MPVKVRKLPNKNRCRVYDGKRVAAKNTTCSKAKKQANLLRGLSHGMKLKKK